MSNSLDLERLKQEYQFTLSKVSHEVRNPVTIIKNYLQLMEEKYPQVESFDYWEDIQENMDYLVGLLDELSDYNNAGRLHTEPVDMNLFLESVVASVKPTLTYLEQRITYESGGALPVLTLDKTKLREAILNLIRNSWEAMEKGGAITVHTALEKDHIILIISDDGPGIPEEYLPDLFRPFITHKKDGTGLGLAITKQIVEAHRGTIRVETVSGEGTSFILTLPIHS